ncbi:MULTISPECIES: MFS transporter [Gordonibacter]|uniref:MFS transporter n=1 Tax=Gordonibacter faecis TaxID=3047475 RepID=A0ABT7DLC6_9ACTN|nr:MULTISPECIES: MFS transporter [unclassified Gordonibacter]MDJ1650042.1 MFS transporter [Gordonibacter sp. KGMB12511]
MDERKGSAQVSEGVVGVEGRNRGAGKGGLTGTFWALAAAQTVSLFGNAVLRFALPLHVLGVTGSSAAMGVVTACAWVPYIVLAPIGGVAADRVRKRLIMAALDAVMAAVCAAYLLLSGTADAVGLAVAALVALYAVQSVYQPTVQASVPALVGRSAIQRGAAVVSQVGMLSSLVGPVLGGLLFGMFGIAPVVAVSGALFAASAVLVAAAVRVPFAPLPRDAGIVRTAAGDLAAALRFLREGSPAIFRMILLATAFNLVLSSFVVIGAPVVVTQVLGLSAQLMGFAEGALALGGLAGGIAAGALAGRLGLSSSPVVLAAGSLALLLVAAACALPLPSMGSYALVVAGLFLTMACCTLFSVQAVAFVQGETPGDLIGKVMALVMALANCATPVGALAYGWLLDAFRDGVPIVVAGVVAASLALSLAVRSVVREGLKGDGEGAEAPACAD